jgi:hypothetical protein
MRRLNRGRTLATTLSAAALAALTAACSSSAAVTTPETPPPSLATAAGYQDTQNIRTCLHSNGISRVILRELFNGASPAKTGFTSSKLQAIGQRCWSSAETGVAATAIRKIDSCLTQEGVQTAGNASPLGAVLLALDVHTTKAQNALRFCLRS